jgi:hypothetical protein
MYAADGTRFTGFSMKSSGSARSGAIWKIAMCRTPYAGCQSVWPRSDTWDSTDSLGSLATNGVPYHAQHLWAGAECAASSCADGADAGRAVDVSHRESHVVVEDFTPPGAPTLRGVSTGWNSGQRQLEYSASDAGSGVAAVTLTVDGSLHRNTNHPCATLAAGGYSRPAPCDTAVTGTFAVNEPGQLADGRHSLTVTTRDAGGESAATTQEFLVDNNAPEGPVSLAVTGGEGWRSANDFALTWQNRDQGSGSGIAGAYYKVGSPPTSPTDGTFTPGAGLSSLTGLRVPADGDWPVYVWLQDEAGNAQHADAVSARLRLDSAAPALAFADERDPDNPAEVRAATADAHSGVAGGWIDIRLRGTAEWRPLETRLEGAELVASIPDEQLERGTYELRAAAWDGVGNQGATLLRADGREMLLDLPLRGDTHVTAGLALRAGGARPARRSVRLRYRRAAWLRGVLRSGSVPLPGTRLTIQTRPPTGGAWQPFTEVVTDDEGGYAVRLPKGVSRELRVHFPGSRSLRPAEETARLAVRGWASLALRPPRLRRGGTIAFVGRVGRFAAAIPAAGKLVQIQYLDGRRWRPAVKLGRTNARGGFAIRYRFRRISRPTRIHFRILVPAEGGWPYATGWSPTRVAHVRP